MIKFEKSSHYYSNVGEARYEATLREARKENLYVSPTTIDKDVFKNDFLDRWKMNELAAAAASTFKQAHETEEDYANRIYEISLEKSRTASEFGKEIHAAIEDYPQYPLDPGLHPWVERFGEWYDLNVDTAITREKVLLDHQIGVAGRCDFIGSGKGPFADQRLLIDFKTQNVKKDKAGKPKPAFYDSWPRQLSFYGVSDAKETGSFPDHIPTCLSLVIDSNTPGAPFVKVWGKEEILDAYVDFVTGAYLWFSKRSYWPCGRWAPTFPFQMPI